MKSVLNGWRLNFLHAVAAILVLSFFFAAYSCKAPIDNRRQIDPSEDTTIVKVILYPNEEKVDSVNRWLWNLMTNGNVSYEYQLKAAESWLLLNKHIKCQDLPIKSKYEYGTE